MGSASFGKMRGGSNIQLLTAYHVKRRISIGNMWELGMSGGEKYISP
jgi:hypothetical protein